MDPMLPFGLHSAPKLFNAVADALEWCFRQQGICNVFHYLDDFIIIAPPHCTECATAVALLDNVCDSLGIPIANHKRDGPATCLTFLGIEIDTVSAELRLPADKLQRLQSLLQEWGDRKTCERRDLESLIGLLNHASKVLRPGRSFLRRMLDLLHGVPTPPLRPHPIRLNREFRSKLSWWRLFAVAWNGISYLPPSHHLSVTEMASDASGSWGCGVWRGHQWFQFQWDQRSSELTIMVKISAELRPELCRYHCDNQAVVAYIRSRTTHDKHCMHMLRTLAFVEAKWLFSLQPQYINTRTNYLADDLSRNNLPAFLSKVPHADSRPTPLPVPLLDILLDPSLDWTSPLWLQKFSATFRTALPPLLSARMTQQ